MFFSKNYKSGFTLLEILLVVGIIAILAGIVIVALNPTKQFAAVRNTQRKANLSELNKALYQYYIDNSRYPTSVPITNLGEICNTGASSTPTGINCTGLVDLSPLVPTYLVAIPADPQASGTSTGYLVAKNTANKIYVKALNSELSQTVALGPSDGILPDHLVSYWSFDDAGSGTALDGIGSNNGTVTGATATTGVKGLTNTAYGFDGSGDYIQYNSATIGNNSITLSAWIKSTQACGVMGSGGSCGIILRDYYSGNFPYGLSFGTFYLNGWITNRISAVGGNWNYLPGTTVLQLNQWYLATMTYSGTNYSVYLNGVLEITGSMIMDLNYGTSVRIGSGYGGYNGAAFNGVIDNVRIYNKALSAEEILSIYNTEKP